MPLELKPAAVKSEVTVTATESAAPTAEAMAPTAQTIPEKIVKECAESRTTGPKVFCPSFPV